MGKLLVFSESDEERAYTVFRNTAVNMLGGRVIPEEGLINVYRNIADRAEATKALCDATSGIFLAESRYIVDAIRAAMKE